MSDRFGISSKDINAKLNAKYSYIVRDLKPVEHKGETVEDFLKRGGSITKIDREGNKVNDE